jgi:hypothetical protein
MICVEVQAGFTQKRFCETIKRAIRVFMVQRTEGFAVAPLIWINNLYLKKVSRRSHTKMGMPIAAMT